MSVGTSSNPSRVSKQAVRNGDQELKSHSVSLPGPEPSPALSVTLGFDFFGCWVGFFWRNLNQLGRKVVSSFSAQESSLKGWELTEPEVASGLNYRHFRTDAVAG